MAGPEQTPDMVGAGVKPGEEMTDQVGMLNALRSVGGSLPQGALQAPNLGLAIGSAALSQPGQNQYLQGFQQQQMQQQREARLQQDRLIRLVEDQRRQANRQQDAALKIAGKFAASDEPGLKAIGYENLAKLGGPLGIKVDPTIVRGLATGQLKKEDLARVIDLYDNGKSPEDIVAMTGLTPQAVARAKGIADSDNARHFFGFQTRAEARTKADESAKKSLELTAEQYGLTPKNPRTPFALQYTQDHFGVSFDKATVEQRKEAIEKSTTLATSADKPTAQMRNAMAEFNPQGDITNPHDVQVAMNLKRGRDLSGRLQVAATQNQLTNVGRLYYQELNRANMAMDRMGTLDNLLADMDRLVQEGKTLGLSGNPQAVNVIQQELVHIGGGPGSKGAEWYRAFDTLNARFATVAQSIEQITGNRLAVTQTTRALGFHPRQTDPYTVQQRIVNELRQAAKKQREAISANISRAQKTYGAAAGAAGVPFVLGGGEGGGEGDSAEEEQ